MGKTVSKIFKTVGDVATGSFIDVGGIVPKIPKAPKIDTSGQEVLAKAQQKELEQEELRKKNAQKKAFAEAERIKKGFRSKGQGLSLLGESEDQLLG